MSYDDGEWTAMTMGFFIGLMVDAGQDPAVLMRVIEDIPTGDENKFTREIEVIMIPNGSVKRVMGEEGVTRVHKTLKALIDGSVVE